MELDVKRPLYSVILANLAVLALISGSPGCTDDTSVTLNVSAAASLTDALKEVNTMYAQKHKDVTITSNFAGSGTLQKQIEQGAPCDVFISAASTQMDALEKSDLILRNSRKNLLNNRVVLVVPDDSELGISSFQDLTKDAIKKIAVGDPRFVPAGTYGKQAIDELGLTSKLQSKLILASDVRQILNYVETGNVDAGIVYSTDAVLSSRVRIVADAPDVVNANIVYPVAVVKTGKNVNYANDYIDFLFSNEAKAIFEKYGFKVAGNWIVWMN